ncbi:MAG TPA: ThuA domain-containing protein [Chthoniobacterales bacterium]|jgi:type 1 glutamine amidotransferase
MPNRVITVLAGEFVHPTTTQFSAFADTAPAAHTLRIIEDASAFDHLDDTDLLVVAGLHWTGSPSVTWTEPVPYLPPTEAQKAALRAYIASGRPVLSVHGGIASYDDWPEFGDLLGISWHWDLTTHGPVKEYRVYPEKRDSALAADVGEFHIVDENYFNVQGRPGVRYVTHLKLDAGDCQLPALLTTDGRGLPGGGRRAYLALGHDQRSTDHPAYAPVLWRTVAWLLGDDAAL